MAVWEKVLWKTQPFDDNHVPADFLSELDRLAIKSAPSLTTLILAALPISQHVSAIALLVAVFYRLLVNTLSASVLGLTLTSATILGWTLLQYGWKGDRPPLRGVILPPLILSLLSPILGTLTSATTSDSIWPLAGGLFFLHLLLADFTTGPDLRLERYKERELLLGHKAVLEKVQEKSLSSSLSLTSALSASIVLASRLSSTGEVFALVLLAVALFAGWPELAKRVRESGKVYSICLTISTAVVAMACLPSIGLLLALTMSNLGGPAMLWYAWRFKVRRGGRWDVAVVRVVKER